MKKISLSLLILAGVLYSGENVLVKITENIPYVDINDSGVNVKISRIQETDNILTDDFAETSRLCPPHCIPPIKTIKGVKTIGELELIDFIKNRVYKKKGILVDARLKGAFMLETIPGAINIPFTVAQVESKKITDSLFKALGAKVNSDGTYDFSKAKDLAVFCSGLWCKSSTKLIKGLVKKGYPADKIVWYRDGLQAWKLLGLTTVVHKAIEAKE
jgi:rhodanese-related sulfurtransferase